MNRCIKFCCIRIPPNPPHIATENWNIEASFSRSFLKHIVNKPLVVSDLEDIDHAYAQSMQALLRQHLNVDDAPMLHEVLINVLEHHYTI